MDQQQQRRIIGPVDERREPVNVLRRRTENRAVSAAEIDDFMQKRIKRYGLPGLTLREYEAVVYSLSEMPTYAFDDTRMNHRHMIDLPTQRWVADKMEISRGRVSQLLTAASQAMTWFEQVGRGSEICWEQLKDHSWHLTAPLVNHAPIPKKVRVMRDRKTRTYRVKFAGELFS